jgi:hypothetical protein
MLQALALGLLLAAAAAAIWALNCTLLRPARRRDVLLVAVASLTFGAPICAWSFALLLRLAPGHDAQFYVIGVAAVCLLCIAIFARQAWMLTVRAIAGDSDPTPERSWLAIGLLALAVSTIALLTFVTPLYENDALEYATIARLIAEQRSLSAYPAVDSAVTGGFYGPWTHPAGFPSILALADLLRSGSDMHLIRAPSVFSAISMALLVGCCARGISGAVAAAVLIGTPIYLLSTINMWIDSIRVSAGFGALVLLCLALASNRAGSMRSAIAIGIAFGLTFFMHSIGVVLIAMASMFILVFGIGKLASRLIQVSLVVAVALLCVAPDLVVNFRNFGAPVADSPPLWRIPELGFKDWMLLARDLYYFGGKFENGVLMGFSQRDFYGFSYFAAAIGAVLAYRRLGRAFIGDLVRHPRATFLACNERTKWLIVGSGAFLFWLGCSLAGIILGVAEFVKNVRYPYTIQPLIALIAGIGLGALFERRGPMSERVVA